MDPLLQSEKLKQPGERTLRIGRQPANQQTYWLNDLRRTSVMPDRSKQTYGMAKGMGAHIAQALADAPANTRNFPHRSQEDRYNAMLNVIYGYPGARRHSLAERIEYAGSKDTNPHAGLRLYDAMFPFQPPTMLFDVTPDVPHSYYMPSRGEVHINTNGPSLDASVAHEVAHSTQTSPEEMKSPEQWGPYNQMYETPLGKTSTEIGPTIQGALAQYMVGRLSGRRANDNEILLSDPDSEKHMQYNPTLEWMAQQAHEKGLTRGVPIDRLLASPMGKQWLKRIARTY